MNVQLKGVHKSYVNFGKRHTVFSDLDLIFPRGRSVGVIGPNGSGKSTLLKLMTGAEVPDKGWSERYTRLSWPIGFGNVFSIHLSGIANARFSARLYDADPDFVCDFTREFSGLGDFMHWPIKACSTGMRARFSFALAMAIDFDCILIDEILGVGDADFKAKCAAALHERRQTADLILVSHNLKDIVTMCDRVIVIGGARPIVSDDVLGTVKRYNLALTGSTTSWEL